MNTFIIVVVVILILIYAVWIVSIIVTTFKLLNKDKKKILHKYKIGSDHYFMNDAPVRIVAYKNEFIGGKDPVYIVKALDNFLNFQFGDTFEASELELSP